MVLLVQKLASGGDKYLHQIRHFAYYTHCTQCSLGGGEEEGGGREGGGGEARREGEEEGGEEVGKRER